MRMYCSGYHLLYTTATQDHGGSTKIKSELYRHMHYQCFVIMIRIHPQI